MTSLSLGTMSGARPKTRSYQRVAALRSATGTLEKRTSIATPLACPMRTPTVDPRNATHSRAGRYCRLKCGSSPTSCPTAHNRCPSGIRARLPADRYLQCQPYGRGSGPPFCAAGRRRSRAVGISERDRRRQPAGRARRSGSPNPGRPLMLSVGLTAERGTRPTSAHCDRSVTSKC